MYDLLAKYKGYILGLTIFLSLSAVSISIENGQPSLVLRDNPFIALAFVSFGMLAGLLYVHLDKKKIDSLSKQIYAVSSNQKEDSKNLVEGLTDRQRQIYHLILSGKSNKEIMSELFIEQSTFKTHINHLYKKLKVSNRKELKSRAKQV